MRRREALATIGVLLGGCYLSHGTPAVPYEPTEPVDCGAREWRWNACAGWSSVSAPSSGAVLGSVHAETD